MSDFQFLRPNFLFIFIPFILLFILLVRSKGATALWHSVCDKDLMPYLLSGNVKKNYKPHILLCLTFSLLILALAGPTWKKIEIPLIKTQSGLVIALDLSAGMDAQDIKPSRLKRAIYKIKDLLKLRKEGQTALIVFSEDPFVVTPLTDDVKTIEAMLPALDTSIMPLNGHRTDLAISKAIDLLRQSGLQNGSILLITSELSSREMEKSIKNASNQGFNVSVLAVGTEERAPIPKKGGGFLTDDKGALIISSLAKDNLKRLADSTQGIYVPISLEDNDINYLNDNFTKLGEKQNEQERDLRQTQWHDQGYLFVLMALPLAALFFRRGFFIFLIFLCPHSVNAFNWTNLWQNPDQQAQQLFHQEKYAEAKELFNNPEWQAAASYKAGDYESAANLYSENETPESLYNYGTAKAKLGDFQEALKAYKKVLEIQPDHEDAVYNKKIIEDFLKQQNENKDKQKNQNDQQQEKNHQNNDNEQQNNQNNDNEEQNTGKEKNQNKDNQERDEEDKRDKDQQDKEEKNQQDKSEKEQNQSNKNNENESNSKKRDQEIQDTEDKANDELKEQFAKQVDEEMEKQEAKERETQVAYEEKNPNDEQRDIDNRWLQRVQDDPGALLRRKFLYQYKQQKQK